MLPVTSDTSITPGRDGSLSGTVAWSADDCCGVAGGVDWGDAVASAADVHATETNPINTIGAGLNLRIFIVLLLPLAARERCH
jgi:hypothetical protein